MAIGGVVIQFRADADKARKDITKLTRTLDGVDQSASKQSKGLSKYAKLGIGALVAGAGAGIFGLVKMGSAAVTMAADFEQSQNILQSNLGASGKQMDKLSELAKELGMSTSFGAQDASNAMVELAKAGLTTSEILGGAVSAAMALAATEGMDLANATGIIANTMAAFGLKAKDSGKIADILAAGASASTASVEDLAGGLKYVGSSARALGVPLLDTVTALAALNQMGLDGTTAGTSFNRMLLALAAPSKKAADAIETLGLNITDAQGNMLPMMDIIDQLQQGLAGKGVTEQAAVLKNLFGVEGKRAAENLLLLGTQGWGALREQVGMTGKAAEMADARMAGFWGSLETAQGAIETLGISLGEKLLPILTGWINDFTAFMESPEGKAWATALGDTIEGLATGLQTWIEETLIPAFESVVAWFADPANHEAIKSWANTFSTLAAAITTTMDAAATAINGVVEAYGKLPQWMRDLQGKAFELLGKASLPGVLDKLGGGPTYPGPSDKPRSVGDPIPSRVTNITVNQTVKTKAEDSVALALRIGRTVDKAV
jgi:TP901 family phage tail tape measure protein